MDIPQGCLSSLVLMGIWAVSQISGTATRTEIGTRIPDMSQMKAPQCLFSM